MFAKNWLSDSHKTKSLFLAILLTSVVSGMAADLMLFYDKPAKDWETEALPIVNG